jgi:hypothetical protein
MSKCLIIANTPYHFDICLSLYASLEQMGFDPVIYALAEENSEQQLFFQKHDLRVTYNVTDKNEYLVCFCVTSNTPESNTSIPKYADPIFQLYDKRIIFISHRFKSVIEYDAENAIVNRANSLFLSKIAKQKHGLDVFRPIDLPNNFNKECFNDGSDLIDEPRYFVQGNYAHHSSVKNPHRDWYLIEEINKRNNNPALIINVCGWSASKLNLSSPIVRFRSSISEQQFYRVLGESHFLLPLISPTTYNGTYIEERFSTNFYMAFAAQKPVFCHEAFASIYDCPGIYYNDDNLQLKIDELFNITKEQYLNMRSEFSSILHDIRLENSNILQQKITTVLQNNNS